MCSAYSSLRMSPNTHIIAVSLAAGVCTVVDNTLHSPGVRSIRSHNVSHIDDVIITCPVRSAALIQSDYSYLLHGNSDPTPRLLCKLLIVTCVYYLILLLPPYFYLLPPYTTSYHLCLFAVPSISPLTIPPPCLPSPYHLRVSTNKSHNQHPPTQQSYHQQNIKTT